MSTSSLLPRRGLPWQQNAIFFSLTAMEMAWFTPIVLIFLPQSWRTPPIFYLLGLWGVMAGMILIAHLFEQQDIASPGFEISVLLFLIVVGFLGIRFYVFSDVPPGNLSWLSALLRGDRATQVLIVLGTLAFLWWRAVAFLQRDINFFIIGYDFRKGVLSLLLSVMLFHYLSSQSAMLFVFVFFYFGLVAIALGRAEDIARTTGDGQAPINRGWLRVIAINTLAVMGIAWAFGRAWSLAGFRALWHLFIPVLGWMAPYAKTAALFLLRLLNPLLEWFVGLIRAGVHGRKAEEILNNLTKNMPEAQKVVGETGAYTPPTWVMILFRYVIPITIGIIVLLLLTFWLVKRRQAQNLSQIEEENSSVESLEGQGLRDALRRGLNKLKEMAGLVSQFGIGKSFYAAISIRNIYANLQKLAAERGVPRDPSWTPNDYLSRLPQAFPGQEAALRHITDVYNAYEYGHVNTDSEEIARLREAWEAIQQTDAP